jgi:hypothetical protein
MGGVTAVRLIFHLGGRYGGVLCKDLGGRSNFKSDACRKVEQHKICLIFIKESLPINQTSKLTISVAISTFFLWTMSHIKTTKLCQSSPNKALNSQDNYETSNTFMSKSKSLNDWANSPFKPVAIMIMPLLVLILFFLWIQQVSKCKFCKAAKLIEELLVYFSHVHPLQK